MIFVLAVRSGAGLAALLAFQGDGESDLVRVIDNIDLVTPYYLLMHRDMRNTLRVQAFADFVVPEIKSFRAMVSGKASVPSDCRGLGGTAGNPQDRGAQSPIAIDSTARAGASG
jgi:hypothetical protein